MSQVVLLKKNKTKKSFSFKCCVMNLKFALITIAISNTIALKSTIFSKRMKRNNYRFMRVLRVARNLRIVR